MVVGHNDLIDQDYWDKLTKEEKEWLNRFNGEYYYGKLDRQDKENNLHQDKEHHRECARRRHAIKRDIYSISKKIDANKRAIKKKI